jgi:hypothetical protein
MFISTGEFYVSGERDKRIEFVGVLPDSYVVGLFTRRHGVTLQMTCTFSTLL